MNAPQRQIPAPPRFDAVFAEHGHFVWRLLVRLGVEARDAADVSQEIFLVVHRRLSDFDATQGSIRSWLSGICLRAASEYRRRSPSRRESSEQEPDAHAFGEDPEHELEARRAWLKLAKVLDALEPSKRQIFVLYELEALPMNEIATLVGCPTQTAYSRLHAARRSILSAFQDGSES